MNASKPKLQAFYGGIPGGSNDQWLFVVSGVNNQECHLFGALLQHIVDNYADIMQTLHDGDGGLILAVKA